MATTASIGNGVTISLSSMDEERRKQLQMTYLAGFHAAVEMARQQSGRKQSQQKGSVAGIDANVNVNVNVNSNVNVKMNPMEVPSSNVTQAQAQVMPTEVKSSSTAEVDDVADPLAALNSISATRTSPRSLAKAARASVRRSASFSGIPRSASSLAVASPRISGKGSQRTSASASNSTVSNPFPRKLMDMLKFENSSIISWLPRGDAFVVRDVDKFVETVLPKYFRHSKVRN